MPAAQPLWKKLSWFVAIWTAGVLALAGVAGLIRLVRVE